MFIRVLTLDKKLYFLPHNWWRKHEMSLFPQCDLVNIFSYLAKMRQVIFLVGKDDHLLWVCFERSSSSYFFPYLSFGDGSSIDNYILSKTISDLTLILIFCHILYEAINAILSKFLNLVSKVCSQLFVSHIGHLWVCFGAANSAIWLHSRKNPILALLSPKN